MLHGASKSNAQCLVEALLSDCQFYYAERTDLRVTPENINIIVKCKFGALDGSHLASESLGHVKRKSMCLEKTLNRVDFLYQKFQMKCPGLTWDFRGEKPSPTTWQSERPSQVVTDNSDKRNQFIQNFGTLIRNYNAS